MKILLNSGHGFNNFGDDAQIFNNIRLLKENGFNDLAMFAPNDYIGEVCSVDAIYPSFHKVFPENKKRDTGFIIDTLDRLTDVAANYPKKRDNLGWIEKHILDAIASCDVLFISGSGTLNTRNIHSLMLALTPCILAQKMGKRVILSGQGFLPLDHPKLTPYMKDMLNRCERIFTRDFDLGYQALKKIGVNMDIVISGIDDAFTTPPCEIKESQKFPINMVVINVSEFLKPPLDSHLHEFAKRLRIAGFNPVFSYFQNDRDSAHECAKGIFPCLSFDNISETVLLFNKALAVVGMRYHSAIIGLAAGKPTINIYTNYYQQQKLEAIEKETGLKHFTIEDGKVTSQTLMSQFGKALVEQPEIIKNLNVSWRQKSNLAVQYLKETK